LQLLPFLFQPVFRSANALDKSLQLSGRTTGSAFAPQQLVAAHCIQVADVPNLFAPAQRTRPIASKPANGTGCVKGMVTLLQRVTRALGQLLVANRAGGHHFRGFQFENNFFFILLWILTAIVFIGWPIPTSVNPTNIPAQISAIVDFFSGQIF
jgi:hypothetical protein